ncbi:YhdP family protein [Caminibacter pacificus]
MKSNNASISAIIFVILYFSFAVFISMFKGLHFYNLKFSTLRIKHLFIKIDKKLILEADNIIILPTNYKTDITNLHKQFYYIFNVSKIFQKIDFKNIKYKKIKVKEFLFQNHKITLKSNLLTLNGTIIPKHNYSELFINEIKYANYKIKDFTGSIKYENNIKITTRFRFQDFLYNLKATLADNIITGVLSTKESQIHFNKINIFTKNLNLNFTYDVQAKKYFVTSKSNSLKIQKNKTEIQTKNPFFDITNDKVSFKLYDTHLKDDFKIDSKKIIGTYFFNSYLFARAFDSTIFYKNEKIDVSFLDISYKNLKNINAIIKNIKIHNNVQASTKVCKVIIYNNYKNINCSNNKFKYKFISLTTQLIQLLNNDLSSKTITGKIKNLPITITNTKINIKEKTLNINKINLNNLIFDNIHAKTDDFKTYIIKLHTNASIDKHLKSTLKEFNITIPITQLSGKNDLNTTLIYSKKLDYNISISSKKPIIQYKDILLSSDNLFAKYSSITKNGEFNTTNLYIPFDFLKIKTSFNGKYLQNKYLNIYAKIINLKLLNLLHITNYDEKIAVNLKRKVFYLINLAIMGDYAHNRFYFYSLKQILKFTPFSGIITNGTSVINIYKNSVKILLTLYLKKPLILNNKPSKNSIFAIMDIDKNNIKIYNQFAHVNIQNLNKLDATIKNADINVNMIIDIIHTVTPLTSKKKTQNKNSKFTAKVVGINTNFIYNKHKFLSEKFTVNYDKELNITSKYKQSSLIGYTKHKYFLLSGKNYSKKELVPLLDIFNHFYKINLDFVLVKSPEDFYTGKVYINKGVVKDLKALNNLIAFLNTIPSLLSLKSPGFSAEGYKIKKGYIDFLYYKNILYFKQIKIDGVNLDFTGKGYIDFNTMTMNLKIMAYMKLNIKNIPVIGKGLSYLLLGKDGSIDVKVVVSGKLDDPKVTQDLGTSIIKTPFELFKRVITLPFNLF